jgi:hypothetical protein
MASKPDETPDQMEAAFHRDRARHKQDRDDVDSVEGHIAAAREQAAQTRRDITDHQRSQGRPDEDLRQRINVLSVAIKELEGYDAAKGEIRRALDLMERYLDADASRRQVVARSLLGALRKEPSLAATDLGQDLRRLANAYA